MSTKRALLLTSALVFLACSSSSSGGGGGGQDVAFHAEAPALPGFSHDTGLQPSTGPAQVELTITAGGPIDVDTVGAGSGGKLQGKPGAGKLKLDVHVKLAGRLKVDAGTVHYDGDLPGVKNVDIPIGGTTTFDGFLLTGDPATVTANVPETKLPDIPLGSVPGHMSLTVGDGSTLSASFKGTCLTVKGGQASLRGETTTSGKLILKAAIVLDIPLFNKSIPLPDIPVDIPKSVKPITSADVAVPGIGDETDGACTAPPPDDSGDGGTTPTGDSGPSGGDSGGDGGGACSPGSVQFSTPDCDSCAHTNCQKALDACFADTSANGCECQALVKCVQACMDDTCVQNCGTAHPAGVDAFDKVNNCIEVYCGPVDAGGNGTCQ